MATPVATKVAAKSAQKAKAKASTKADTQASTEVLPIISRGDERQAQLLEIACRLFSQYGFKGTSLRDIAQEADITKAALYYHFPNKEALFQKIVVESFVLLLERVNTATARAVTAHDKVLAFMMTSADYYQQNRNAWVASSNAFWSKEESDSRNQALTFRDQYEKLLRKCIEEGIASGEFRAVDPAMAGRVLLSSINSMNRWHNPAGRLTAAAVVEQFLDIVLVGMKAR
jgi:AcrR family transcriptional regulator